MPPKVRVTTSKGIARAAMRQGSETRRQFLGRAQLAAMFYNKEGFPPPRKFDYEKSSSPFERKDQDSVRGSAKIFPKLDSVDIIVNAPAARFVERGTSTAPITRKDGDKKFYIPIKESKARTRRGGKSRYLRIKGDDVRLKYNKQTGQFLLVTKRVRPFVGGYRRLQRSIETAFRESGARRR